MANARWLFPNLCHSAAAVITTDAADSLRPASYLASPWRSKKWRSPTDTSSHRIIVDLGSSQSVQALAVINPKIHTGGKLWAQWRTDTSAFSAPPADNAIQFATPSTRSKLTVIYLGSPTSMRRVSFYFENTGAVSEYVEAAVPWASVYMSLSVNIRDDVAFERVDPSRITASPDGQRQALQYTQFSKFEGTFSEITASDADLLVAMFASVGVSSPIILAIDPADFEQTAFGFLQETIRKQSIAGSILRFDVPVSFEEAR